jgi:hypothetical protein
MQTAKIEVKIGAFSFSGEGDEVWIAKQLDKVLEQTKHFDKSMDSDLGSSSSKPDSASKDALKSVTLPSFLSSKGATTNQVKKFLATATWLQLRGMTRLSTKDVSKALKDTNQNKLNNPALNLLQNIGKGLCEKDGNKFFVTDDGIKSIG